MLNNEVDAIASAVAAQLRRRPRRVPRRGSSRRRPDIAVLASEIAGLITKAFAPRRKHNGCFASTVAAIADDVISELNLDQGQVDLPMEKIEI